MKWPRPSGPGRRTRLLLLEAASLVCIASPALASDGPLELVDLRVELPVVTLRMRAAAPLSLASQTESDAPRPSRLGLSGSPREGDQAGQLERLRSAGLDQDAVPPPSPLAERVVFRFNLGFGLDGGRPSGEPALSGAALDEDQQYQRLRIYGFGDAVIGSRGLGAQSLNTYLAANFRVEQKFAQQSTSSPTVFDGDGVRRVLVRSAYAEADHFLDHPRLAPLYLRAGRIFKYGPAVAHFDGVALGYDVPALRFSVYGGTRTSLYGLAPGSDGAISGSEVRVDLFEWKRIPLVLYGHNLTFDDVDHFRTGLALRWSRNILVQGDLRTLDGERAQLRLALRARLSEVTTVKAELSDRSRNDWSYGFLLLERPESGDPRRYLDLGPILPRTQVTLRYGTVVLRNLDLLLRAAAALDRRSESDPASSSQASYLEGGGAVEVRVRRSLRVGTAFSARQYAMEEAPELMLRPGSADPLVSDTGAAGVRSFFEGGLSFHYSAGARTFNADAEFYGRLYRMRSPYLADELQQNDLRTGGRFSIEAWAFERIRLRSEYDMSFSAILLAPELAGLKTLRILMEGTF